MKNRYNDEIQDFMDRYTELWPFSGSILVAHKGEIIHNQGYGMASLEFDVANTPKTKHRICSISKQFTAMAIMILHEKGLLKLDDSTKLYFEDYPELDERITIHHLLTHTSGLMYRFGDCFEKELSANRSRFDRHEAMFKAYRSAPLLCEPGEAFHYSNYGYYLLACIVERASGQTYEAFLKLHIFEPLKMMNTGVERDKKIIKNLATGYYLTGDEIIRFKPMNVDHAFGAGDLYSTVEDLFLWDRALNTHALVSQETLDMIFTPYAFSGETGSAVNDYGYGWFIEEKFEQLRISHGGGGLGFITEIHRYPKEDLCIIILSNYGFTAVYKLTEILAAIVFNKSYKFPDKPKAFELGDEVFKTYLGTYKNDIEKLDVEEQDGERYFVIDDEYKIPIYPITDQVFHHTWIDEAYAFEKSPEGVHYFIGLKKCQ